MLFVELGRSNEHPFCLIRREIFRNEKIRYRELITKDALTRRSVVVRVRQENYDFMQKFDKLNDVEAVEQAILLFEN